MDGGNNLPSLWMLACSPVSRQLFRNDGPPSGGGGGPGDPTAPFRGPPSVSPSPSIADDDDMRGGDGGGPAATATTTPAPFAEPPAGSVIEPMEEPPGQQSTPHRLSQPATLPPAALPHSGQPQQVPQPIQPLQAPSQPGLPTFEQQRRRHEHQEAMVLPKTYGPAPRTLPRLTPYSERSDCYKMKKMPSFPSQWTSMRRPSFPEDGNLNMATWSWMTL